MASRDAEGRSCGEAVKDSDCSIDSEEWDNYAEK
jgi:hypothetical protein